MRSSNHGRDLVYSAGAGRSGRTTVGSVQVLYQRFGDSVLLVTTRSPQRTEDVDFSIGMTIMAEGHRWFPHVAVVDAHNCMTDLSSPVLLATLTATEYQKAAVGAMEACRTAPQYPFRIGVAHHHAPLQPGDGVRGSGHPGHCHRGRRAAELPMCSSTATIWHRECGKSCLRRSFTLVDDAEIMTTDSHVVNTITGKNPVGMNVPVSEFTPYVIRALNAAMEDLAPAEAAAGTAHCEHIVVFGSNRISQLASTVNAMLVFVAPLSLAMLLLAFLLSIIAYHRDGIGTRQAVFFKKILMINHAFLNPGLLTTRYIRDYDRIPL